MIFRETGTGKDGIRESPGRVRQHDDGSAQDDYIPEGGRLPRIEQTGRLLSDADAKPGDQSSHSQS